MLDRFERIAGAVQGAVDHVFLSFLQTNDLMAETRDQAAKLEIMIELAAVAAKFGIKVLLCNEDRTLFRVTGLPDNLGTGVCAAPEFWGQPEAGRLPSEGCGCVLTVDPFTINESCTMGCEYCYAADKSLARKKRNTTRGLPVIR